MRKIILLIALAVAVTAGCEGTPPPGCHIVQPQSTWDYSHGVWTGDLGQVVAIAATEDSNAWTCPTP